MQDNVEEEVGQVLQRGNDVIMKLFFKNKHLLDLLSNCKENKFSHEPINITNIFNK